MSIHVLAPVSFQKALVGTPFWWAANIINSASRWSVPVFFMVSGALLLNRTRQETPAEFYRRRLARIGIPLLAWSVIYVPVLVNRGIPVTLGSWLTSFAAGAPYHHLYFLFALFGCYLVVPLLNRLSSRELGVVAALALGWAMAERVLQVAMPHSPANALELWLYFVGYFAAGGWLVRRPAGPAIRWFVVACAAVAATAAGTWWLIAHGPSSQWNLMYSYLSIPTVIASVAVFELVRKIGRPDPGWLQKVAAATFGIYLCHPLILVAVQRVMPLTGGPLKPSVMYIVEMSVVLAGSLGLTLLLMRIPYIRAIVGG